MTGSPTFASVTVAPCTCQYVERAAEDPQIPIAFDPPTNEHHFTFGSADAPGLLVIYHCPFCGGAAPRSKRDLLFATVPPEEERLIQMLRRVRTIRSALQRLGRPERDDPSGTRSKGSEGEGPSVTAHHRMLVYERLSPVADVWIMERSDGTVHWWLQGKRLGPLRR